MFTHWFTARKFAFRHLISATKLSPQCKLLRDYFIQNPRERKRMSEKARASSLFRGKKSLYPKTYVIFQLKSWFHSLLSGSRFRSRWTDSTSVLMIGGLGWWHRLTNRGSSGQTTSWRSTGKTWRYVPYSGYISRVKIFAEVPLKRFLRI